MQTENKSGIFTSPQVRKKVVISLSFVFVITMIIAVMTHNLPEHSNSTGSFILNYYIYAFGLAMVYSLFLKDYNLALYVSIVVGITCIFFIIGNNLANYEKDFQGVNPRVSISVLLIIMFLVSCLRINYLRVKVKPEPK